jgi:DNA invertase Pin-like site-specific DNA recombinase
MKAALYIRVSTSDQNAELQVRELRAYAEHHGWEITQEYADVMSGGQTSRPKLNQLLAAAREKQFDTVLTWKLDRIGRSLVHCLNIIRELEENGIRFIAVTQNLDTDQRNPAAKFLLHVLGAAAEFERALIRERTQAGRLRYQQDYDAGRVGNGVFSRSGRNLPPHRPRRIFDREQVAALRCQGLSLREIAKKLGLGLGTVTRTLQLRSKSS